MLTLYFPKHNCNDANPGCPLKISYLFIKKKWNCLPCNKWKYREQIQEARTLLS